MTEGIIFIEFKDPINQIAKRAARQLYSTMGVFYTNYLAEKPELIVWLPKIYGENDPIVKGEIRYVDLLNHELVARVALSQIKDQGKNRTDFLSNFATLKSKIKVASCSELLDLFLGCGTDIDIAYKNTGVGFVNTIVSKMGKSQSLQKINPSSLEYMSDEANFSSNAKNNILIEYMTTFKSQVPLGQYNFLMASYLTPNDIFELPKPVELAPRNPETVNRMVEEITVKFSERLADLKDTFVTKLSNNSVYNHEFVKTVINSFNDTKDEQKRSRQIINRLIESLKKSGQELSNLWEQDEVSWNELSKHQTEFNDANEILNMISGKTTLSQPTSVHTPALSYDIKVNVDNKPTPVHLFLRNLTDFISRTNEHLTSDDKRKELHWGELVSQLNMVLLQSSLPTIGIPESNSSIDALVTFVPSNEINLELVTGRHVTITNRKGDEKTLASLTTEELENLNCVLNVIATKDRRLDAVRSHITRLLASK